MKQLTRNDMVKIFTEYLLWLKEFEKEQFEEHKAEFELIYEHWANENVTIDEIKRLKALHMNIDTLNIGEEGKTLWRKYIRNAMQFGLCNLPEMMIKMITT